jgi:hypothetical protein
MYMEIHDKFSLSFLSFLVNPVVALRIKEVIAYLEANR